VANTGNSRGRRARLRLRTLTRWLKYFETAPVSRDETLLRAIPNTPDHLNEDMGNWKVAPYAFKPNKSRDTDGMSFFREDFSSPKRVAKANRHRSGACVARITARQFEELKLTVTTDPIDDEPAGHAIVPGMQFVESMSKEERRQIKDLSQKLAQFASNNPMYFPRGLSNPVRQQYSTGGGESS
jgi:hypothetical protein